METKAKGKRKFQMPHAMIILILIALLCMVLTWVLPAGQFERVYNEELGRNLVVPGSYHRVEASPVNPWQFVISLYDGMIDAADIIFFILIAASYVYVLSETGALNALTGWMMRKLGDKDIWIIPIFMLLFGLGGTTFGMFEETYGLIPAFIIIAITLGYDRIVGGAIVFVGVATGFAAATLNPFTIGVASKVAEIPLVTPQMLLVRIICFVLFEALAIFYTMRYAKKIRKDPTKSYMYGDADELEGLDIANRDAVKNLPFNSRQKASLIGFILLIVFMAFAIIKWGFYFSELAALFLIWMVVTCIINGMSANKIADMFVEGCRSAIYGALLVGFARAISIIMTDGNVIDTAVLGLSNAVQSLPNSLTGIGMLVVQNIINFFIPSGSGQAVVMMPIMAPLADLCGLSREVAVLAFQFGDGFSNMFWPTAVATECGIMGISLNKWYKFITPLFLMMFALQAIVIVACILVGL